MASTMDSTSESGNTAATAPPPLDRFRGNESAGRHAPLHPGTGFLIALFAGASTFIMPSAWWAWAVAAAVVVVALVHGVGAPFLKTAGATIVVLAIFMGLFRALFTPGEQVYWRWGGVIVSDAGLAEGVLVAGRVLALAGAIMLYFRITPSKDIVTALESSGLPPAAAYVLLSTLQMVPELRKQMAVIMDAQRARGVETEGNILSRAKAFVPVLGPLVLSSVTATEQRAITLEARAFTARGPKTRLYTVMVSRRDRVYRMLAVAGFVVLAGIGVLLRVSGGHS